MSVIDEASDLLSTPLPRKQLPQTEEFVNRNHTPTSAHPNLVAMPPLGSKAVPYAWGNEATNAFAKSVYNMKFANGIVAEVDNTSYDGEGSLSVSGSFYDYEKNPGGEPDFVGMFERKFDAVPGEVHHEMLSLLPSWQGQGMATQFNAHAEEMYKAYGVHKIFLDAASTVGGYTWAVAGYDWNGDFDHGILKQIRGLARTPGDLHKDMHLDDLLRPTMLHSFQDELLTPSVRKEFGDIVRRVDAGERVAPFEIAQVGKNHVIAAPTAAVAEAGQILWAGKALLLGNTWFAVKRLDVPEKVSVNTPSAKQADRDRLTAIMKSGAR